MKILMYLLLIAMFALPMAASAQASGEPFPKERKYMSQAGYDRWQNFKETGVWAPREDTVQPTVEGEYTGE